MSSQASGKPIDLSTIRSGATTAAASGVPHADLLVRYAEALVEHDEAGISGLRTAMIEALGPEGFLEAVTVAANFQRMVRIADSTGIAQDGPLLTLAGNLVDELSLRDFASASHTPRTGLFQRALGRLLQPWGAKLMVTAAERMNAAAKK